MTSESKAANCLSCQIIAYIATSSLTCYGLITFKRNKAPGAILSAIGLVGLSTFALRDLRKLREASK